MVSPSIDQIQELTRRIVESEGLELVDLEFKHGKPRNLLRVFIDKPGGVTLGDCENISNQLGTLLDVNDVVPNAYVLEVSSPGLDRPLRTDKDYERAKGRFVRLTVTDHDGKRAEVIGELKDFDDRVVVVDRYGAAEQIDRDRIQRAQQEIVISAPKKNRKKHK